MTDNNLISSDDKWNDGGCKVYEVLPDGLTLQHNQVHPEVWSNIQHWFSTDMLPSSSSSVSTNLIRVPIPWETGPQMQGRRVAQFGNCKYNYRTDVAEYCDNDMSSLTSDNMTDNVDSSCCRSSIPPIPKYIQQHLLDNRQLHKKSEQFTQCIINMYKAENEIPWHIDHEHFGEKVLVYTFGDDRPLLLRKPYNDNGDGDKSITIHNENNQSEDDNNHTYIYTQVFPRHGSKYVLSGPARHEWEHSVPSGKSDRVSITFRSWIGPK